MFPATARRGGLTGAGFLLISLALLSVGDVRQSLRVAAAMWQPNAVLGAVST